MIVLEEVGRSLAPSPLLSSLVTAEALLAGGTDEAKERLLPRIATGEVAAYVVPGEPSLFADQATILVAATEDGLVELDPASSRVNGCLRWTRPTISRHSTRAAGPPSVMPWPHASEQLWWVR